MLSWFKRRKKSVEEIAHKLDDVDLILVETRASGLFPVMEILREGFSETCITLPEKLAAIIGDKPYPPQRIWQLGIHDLAGIVAFIQELMGIGAKGTAGHYNITLKRCLIQQ